MEVLELERTLTELDHVRLTHLLRRGIRAPALPSPKQPIEDVLNTCAIVPAPQLPADVVTMHSQVLLQEHASGDRTELTLCYPADADPTKGFVSVLSPMGSSLLGLRVGDVARWPTPTGLERSAEVLVVLFQPEASRDYSM